jgi:hypothetical protein
MAKRGREAAAKRAREVRRQQQKDEKRERREAASGQSETLPPEDQTALMEEFAALSEKFGADLVTAAQYAEERHRIFVALGIESDEDAP